MQRFMNRSKGVITVFLIIIMLPVLTLGAVLIDGSRLMSARMITQEAADLATLSVIADYNSTLKDQFGLFALNDSDNAQDIFETYFMESLVASGVGNETEYSDQVYGIVRDTLFGQNKFSGSSFLNLYDFTVDSSTVTPMYTLANHEVLGNQIVEYSKYRGIKEIAERLEILNNFDKVTESIENTKESTDIMKLKKDADTYGGLMSDIQKASWQLDTSSQTGEEKSNSKYFNEKYNNINMKAQAYLDEMYEIVERLSNGQSYSKAAYNDAKGELIELASEMRAHLNDLETSRNEILSKAPQMISKYNELKAILSGEEYEGNETAEVVIDDIDMIVGQLQSSINMANGLSAYPIDQQVGLLEAIEQGPDKITELMERAKNESEEVPDPYVFYNFPGKTPSTSDGGTTAGLWYEQYIDERLSALRKYPDSFHNPFVQSGDVAESIDEEKAKEQADKANQESDRKSENETLSQDEIDALPSRSFDPKAEAESYGNVAEGDKAASFVPDSQTYTFDGNSSGTSDFDKIVDMAGNTLAGFAESGRDDILIYSYILGTFKTRLTPKDFETPFDVNAKYVTEWRYNGSEFVPETDLRGDSKRERETKFSSSEVEYIFGGSGNEGVNEGLVFTCIFGTRLANNLVAVYTNTSINSQCHAAAAAASAATLGVVPEPVFFWAFIAAWAAGETAVEMDFLLGKGYRIPLIKTSQNLLITSFANLVADETDLTRSINQSVVPVNVCYEDYLVLLMAIVPRQTRIMRIADLVQINMQALGQDDFKMDQAFTYVRSEASLSTRYMFMSVKQFSEGYKGLSGRLKFDTVVYQGY